MGSVGCAPGGELAGGFCNTQSDPLVPVLGECYHCWLLRKSPRWGEPASPQRVLAPPLLSLSLGLGGQTGALSGGRQGHEARGWGAVMTGAIYQALPVSLAVCVLWVISWDPPPIKCVSPKPIVQLRTRGFIEV